MADGKTALIVGASRGLGLGLVREFSGRGWVVTATVRDPSSAKELTDLGVGVEQLDVTDLRAVEALSARLGRGSLDLLVLNAGVSGPRDLPAAELEAIAATFITNAAGPARAAHALAGAVKPRTGVVAFMSSLMGSIGDNNSGGSDTYRASKAAMNSYARSFHHRAAEAEGITTLSLHPGWVRTDMGGERAPLDVDTSVRGLAEVCEAASGRGDHRFIQYDGRELPW
ncbi:MAG: SDR family oxidoreductase [Proteobacteria bacterium]|nr:SDR family oxidoreductase [Pseudomonadota bacterium]